jgi:hypothetical protein
LNRAIVKAGGQALQKLDVADRAVAPDDDLEDDFACESSPSCLFRIVGLHFAQQAGWGDPAAWPIRTAADPTARSRADAGTGAFSNADARSAACAAAKTAAAGILTRGHLFQKTGAVARVR